MAGTYGTETVLGSLIVIGWHDRPRIRSTGMTVFLSSLLSGMICISPV
ncbi:MAG: hypothetical protein OXE85_04945 [Roseovarius sp.]|nr:hypothetical protein [Roseovarius sp.]